MKNCSNVDLHIHSVESDGTFTINEILEASITNEIRMLSITDHDVVTHPIIRSKQLSDLVLMSGIEITTIINKTKIHLLVYNYGWESKLVNEVNDIYHYNIVKYKKSIKDRLNLKSFQRKYLTPKQIIKFAHLSAGLVVLAHPFRYDLTNEQRDKIITYLIDLGCDGLECVHPEHDEFQMKKLIEIARSNNLAITGGSDFHGRPGSSIGYASQYMSMDFSMLKEFFEVWNKRYRDEKNSRVISLYPFWNCEGTYYCYLFQENNVDVKAVLSIYERFIVRCSEFNNDDIIKLIEKNNNPWTFQPIIFETNNHEKLNFELLISELLTNINIKVETIRREQVEDIFKFLKSIISEKKVFLINIDEFYMPTSEPFYGKQHNKHFILVENIVNNVVTFIDSEYSAKKIVGLNSLADAFNSNYFRNMVCKIINTKEMKIKQDNFINKELCEMYIKSSWKNTLLSSISSITKDDMIKHFVYCGISLNLRFKLIPYINFLQSRCDDYLVKERLKLELVRMNKLVLLLSYLDMKKDYDDTKIRQLLLDERGLK